jgi:hypothetical protein
MPRGGHAQHPRTTIYNQGRQIINNNSCHSDRGVTRKIKCKWLERRFEPHDDFLLNLDNEDVPMSRPVFMVCRVRMAEIHDGPPALDDKFEM